jgi:uncharacterized protein (TIGR02452 family)
MTDAISVKEPVAFIASDVSFQGHHNTFPTMKREDRLAIFEENQSVFRDKAVVPSRLVPSSELNGSRKPCPFEGKIDVQDMTTSEAFLHARKLGYKNIVLHNFASNRRVGGGYSTGAVAQEEDCCRCFPQLYRSLKSVQRLYPFEKRDVIVTDPVSMFRTPEEYRIVEEPIKEKALFVSAAAPNQRTGEEVSSWTRAALRGVFLAPFTRPEFVKECDKSRPCLVLGAWGCGVFRNDPVVMAELTKEAIGAFGGKYAHIIVAIPLFNKTSEHNFDAFERVLLRSCKK